MLRFFKYYGSKMRIAKHYSKPRHDLVIEPFAGSAGYSVFWNVPKVKLYDKTEFVCKIWDFLIKCSEDDINRLPDYFTHIDQVKELPDGPRQLVFRWLFTGNARTEIYNLDLSWHQRNPQSHWSPDVKRRLISQKPFIKDWTIECLDYKQIPNIESHWHIDPPYIGKAGIEYQNNNKTIDFDDLADWIYSRKGSVEVCEMEGANW